MAGFRPFSTSSAFAACLCALVPLGAGADIRVWTDQEEVIARANDTEYGLVAYVFSEDFKRALQVCERLEYGMVGLNRGLVSDPAAPFGGVKQSGPGREGGQEKHEPVGRHVAHTHAAASRVSLSIVLTPAKFSGLGNTGGSCVQYRPVALEHKPGRPS